MADEKQELEILGEHVSGDGWQWNAVVDGVPFVATLADDKETITLEKASAGGTRITLHPFSLAPEKADETESVIRAFKVAEQVAARKALASLRTSWRSDKRSKRTPGEALHAIEFEQQLAGEREPEPAKREPSPDDFENMREAFERERSRGRALFEALEQVTDAVDLPHTQPRLAANESNAGIDRFAESVARRVEAIQSELEATRFAALCYREALEKAAGGSRGGYPFGHAEHIPEQDAAHLLRRVEQRLTAAERSRLDSGDWRAWAIDRLAPEGDSASPERMHLADAMDFELRDRLDRLIAVDVPDAGQLAELEAWKRWAYSPEKFGPQISPAQVRATLDSVEEQLQAWQDLAGRVLGKNRPLCFDEAGEQIEALATLGDRVKPADGSDRSAVLEDWRKKHGQSRDALRTRGAELWLVVEQIMSDLQIARSPDLVDGVSLKPLRERIGEAMLALLHKRTQAELYRELAARHCPPSAPDESDESLRRRLDAQLVEAKQAAPWLKRLKRERSKWHELAQAELGIKLDGNDSGDVLHSKLSAHVDSLRGSEDAWRNLALRFVATGSEADATPKLRAALGQFCESTGKVATTWLNERERLTRELAEAKRRESEPRAINDDEGIRDIALDTLSGDPVAVAPPPFVQGDRVKLGGVRWKCVDVQWQPDPGGGAEWQRVAYLERLASREG